MANVEKTYQVVIDPVVNERMAEHMEFLARVSEEAADNLLEEMMAGVKSLQKLPFRNPFYNRTYLPIDKYRSYLFGDGRYRIVYQVVGKFVFVDDVQDTRQDEDKNSKVF